MKRVLIFIIVIALLAAGGALFLRSRGSNVEPVETLEGLNFVFEDQLMDASEFDRIEGQVYLSYDFIKEYIDPTITYDSGSGEVIITNQSGTKRLPINSTTGLANEKEFSIRDPLIEKEGKILVPIEVFIYDYDVNLRYVDDQQLIILDRNYYAFTEGEALRDTAVRRDEDSGSEALTTLSKGDRVYVFEEYQRSYKVRAQDGIPGYVPKTDIKLDLKIKEFKHEIPQPEQNQGEDVSSTPINLTWDYTYGKLENADSVQYMDGVNVVAPTWFSVSDANGAIVDRGNREYVNKYHDYGVEVWVTIDNSFDADLTKQFLSSSRARSNIIRDTLDLMKYYNLDGLNIDFEHIYEEDRDLLTQFVREITSVFKTEGYVVSIDVTPVADHMDWGREYDRKALAEIVDYVMVMAYDQHWAGSPTAGSVAQYTWVEGSINGLFRSIPTDKMVLGIPLYTRVWTEENGEVTSQAVGMADAKAFMARYDMNTMWDEESRQYFGMVEEDGKVHKVWLEEGESIAHKASLVNKYGLAGVGTWRKGFEEYEVWSILERTLF